LAEKGIIFIDEIDKIARAGENRSIDTSNILFICGGAFAGVEDIIKRRIGGNTLGFGHQKRTKEDNKNILSLLESDDLVTYGLIPELIGRLHIIATLKEISVKDMVRILVEPKNSLVKQYQALFELDNVQLTFDDKALESIAKKAISRKTGARGLRSILEDILLDIMYQLPDLSGYEVVITEDVIEKKEQPLLVKNKKSA